MTDQATVAALVQRVEVLESEADIRRLQARCMPLWDTLCPESGVNEDAHRVDHDRFRPIDGVSKTTRTRTENVFVSSLREYLAEAFPATSALMRP
jgi:hypothetical protein